MRGDVSLVRTRKEGAHALHLATYRREHACTGMLSTLYRSAVQKRMYKTRIQYVTYTPSKARLLLNSYLILDTPHIVDTTAFTHICRDVDARHRYDFLAWWAAWHCCAQGGLALACTLTLLTSQQATCPEEPDGIFKL